MTRFALQSWHQQAFDGSTSPPLPLLSLQIAGPDEQDWLEIVHALVDTGADATVIPDAMEWDQARLRSQWGEYRFIYRYEVDLRIENRTFASILVVADDVGDDVIIGRDVLNRLRFLYDGPAQQLLLVE